MACFNKGSPLKLAPQKTQIAFTCLIIELLMFLEKYENSESFRFYFVKIVKPIYLHKSLSFLNFFMKKATLLALMAIAVQHVFGQNEETENYRVVLKDDWKMQSAVTDASQGK